MNITEALANKGLKILNGERRLTALLEMGEVALLVNAEKKMNWEISIEGDQLNIVESKIDPHAPGVLAFLTKSVSEIPAVKPMSISTDPGRPRTRRDEDDSPSP
ncbi:hypothetical protein [Pseudomonas amygdali]|uniref:ParB/Sulfiredoxin domain-containing protein n=2 Tax=Pseudomonas amygdali pv. lachrymans TaxID=53707 RepID=A0ABR5KRK4_PSEAV|nr:hypothetical protein [Pseudomonas amygdali]AXH59739.1 hypothetical protein PLA107_031445 [Pseudomonas amygdali pv. lachrymans str. M301315]KPC17161.1 Uncharacterized protein AC499_0363 [Pseudomonas amygdali pv. lachrymans]KPC18120.1 Uncharacterized protein AC499_1322 [Pseudomonas amygdali pv. lachrymans]RMT05904.1 hypothetical protein ALP54_03642 [Pseudomonas amygdali pv. lachrymans]